MEKIRRIKDWLRYEEREIIIKFDPDNVIELPCHCRYDPALITKNGKRVRLLKKADVRKNDGSWQPYPTISQLWGGGIEGQCYTRALIKITGEEDITVSDSENWCPDTVLLTAAEAEGIYTEIIEHD